jgi:hypothetical protein
VELVDASTGAAIVEVDLAPDSLGPVSIVYWSDFGDRDHMHFSKYEVPRRLEPGQRLIFALSKRGEQTFGDYSAPLDRPRMCWLAPWWPSASRSPWAARLEAAPTRRASRLR